MTNANYRSGAPHRDDRTPSPATYSPQADAPSGAGPDAQPDSPSAKQKATEVARFNAETQRERAIRAGQPADVEPFAELRDTRKLDEPQKREADQAAQIRNRTMHSGHDRRPGD
jgi:hypothetical protein